VWSRQLLVFCPWSADNSNSTSLQGRTRLLACLNSFADFPFRRWGADLFAMPHGLTIDDHDNVWVTDVALQQVYKFSADGRLLLTLGEGGVAGPMPVISIALRLLPSQLTVRFT
jgi:hypothetical protein